LVSKVQILNVIGIKGSKFKRDWYQRYQILERVTKEKYKPVGGVEWPFSFLVVLIVMPRRNKAGRKYVPFTPPEAPVVAQAQTYRPPSLTASDFFSELAEVKAAIAKIFYAETEDGLPRYTEREVELLVCDGLGRNVFRRTVLDALHAFRAARRLELYLGVYWAPKSLEDAKALYNTVVNFKGEP
jgi:hypothetical protein